MRPKGTDAALGKGSAGFAVALAWIPFALCLVAFEDPGPSFVAAGFAFAWTLGALRRSRMAWADEEAGLRGLLERFPPGARIFEEEGRAYVEYKDGWALLAATNVARLRGEAEKVALSALARPTAVVPEEAGPEAGWFDGRPVHEWVRVSGRLFWFAGPAVCGSRADRSEVPPDSVEWNGLLYVAAGSAGERT